MRAEGHTLCAFIHVSDLMFFVMLVVWERNCQLMHPGWGDGEHVICQVQSKQVAVVSRSVVYLMGWVRSVVLFR